MKPHHHLSRRVIAGAALGALALPAPIFARADQPRVRALLVGVCRYPNLPSRLTLAGPHNDVALMREALLACGARRDDIRVLSDAPTRNEILSAMAALKSQARPGERVVLHFSGHGAQQPQPDRPRYPEPDGLDDVFLPSDARAWDGQSSQKAIPNAIVDDEIGDWMDAVVDAGAKVHAFFDCCHAAGMARAMGEDGLTGIRAVHARDLGYPVAIGSANPFLSGSAPEPARGHQGRLDGRVLAFACRAHEITREEWLPRGASMSEAKRYGVFSFHAAGIVRNGRAWGAAQLAQAIKLSYELEGRTAPQPRVLGDVGL